MLNRSRFLKFRVFMLMVELIVVVLLLPLTVYAVDNDLPVISPIPAVSHISTTQAEAADVASTFCTGVSEIPSTECEALVTLYNSTNGTNWTNHTGWLDTTTPCTWNGVACDTGHVAHLFLGENNLSGSIPAELSNLTGLLEIYFYGNSLSGSIPPQLGTLSNLQVLNLYGNHLSGGIPPELGNLGSLQTLDLGSNTLSGNIPLALGSLSHLQTLYLGGNTLSGSIPPELGSLSALQVLAIGNNSLSGSIPTQFSSLLNLQTLDLQFNGLTGNIPPGLGNLTHLQWLNLKNNHLSGSIPPELGSVSSLVKIYLGENQLSGSLPSTLGNLSNLQELYIYANNLSGNIPPELGELTNLVILDFGVNTLSGSIPPELGSLSNLQKLVLINNHLTGSIPPELGNLTNLQDLNLSGNQLIGTIPAVLGSLSNLQYLGLGYNTLTGSIPPELGNLTNLISLGLNTNLLTGSIPPELGNLSHLQGIGLSANNLSGNIPPELGDLTSLQTLDMLNDNLSGSIPPELGNLTNLRHIELAFNHLSGSIPAQFGNLTNLQELFLAHNRLSGSIPAGLGNLVNLQVLDLGGGNQLSGDIPPQLTNLTNLQTLSLEFNMLTASDANLISWLNAKQPGWDNSQTVPPTNVQAATLSSSSLRITWTPILYTNHGGYYEVGYSSNVSGPFDQTGCITADKTVSTCDVVNLSSDTPYYFAVRTFTPAHADAFQQNDLLSSFSAPVLGTTAPIPANDDFVNATTINTGFAPFSDTQNVTGASLESGDPAASCGGTPAFHTVWYNYTSLGRNVLSLNTAGSDYDTVVSVWTGTGLGALAQVGCNDNSGALTTSALTLTTTPGTTYYIRVSGRGDGPANLTFHAAVVSSEGQSPLRNTVTTATPLLSWNKVTGATSYTVQVSKSSAFTTLAYSVNVSANQLSITTDPLKEGIYYWRVSADNGLTWSTFDSIIIDLP